MINHTIAFGHHYLYDLAWIMALGSFFGISFSCLLYSILKDGI